MTRRDATITCHLETSLKRDLQEVADERDQSLSELVRDSLKREVAEAKRHDVVQRTKAADKIERVIAEGKDEIREEIEKFNETASAIQSLTARAGVYAVADFEMNFDDQNRSQTMRNDLMTAGSKRLRKDIVEDLNLDLDLEEIPEMQVAENGDNGENAEMPWQEDE